jgi:hypothetical protein
MASAGTERGFYDPKQEIPQTNAQDLIGYREFYDLDYAMSKQREGGVTSALPAMAARWTGLRGICFKSAPATPSSSSPLQNQINVSRRS